MAAHVAGGASAGRARPLGEKDIKLMTQYLAGTSCGASGRPGAAVGGVAARRRRSRWRAPSPARRRPVLLAGPYASSIQKLEDEIKSIDKKVVKGLRWG